MSNKYNPELESVHLKALGAYLVGSIKEKLEFVRVSPEYMIELAKWYKIELNTDDIDTNGWEQDYWIKGTFEGKRIMFSGSMWYGFGEIYWDTDSEDEG